MTEADEYHTITPYLVVEGADRLIEFLGRVFDGTATERLTRPDGSVMHAEIDIGDSTIMIGDATAASGRRPGMLYVRVEDTDDVYRRALEAGAVSVTAPADQVYGHRNAAVRDAFGNEWWIWTRLEVVSQEEIARRLNAST